MIHKALGQTASNLSLAQPREKGRQLHSAHFIDEESGLGWTKISIGTQPRYSNTVWPSRCLSQGSYKTQARSLDGHDGEKLLRQNRRESSEKTGIQILCLLSQIQHRWKSPCSMRMFIEAQNHRP